MKRLVALSCIVPAFIYANSLQELLESATQNNSMIASMKYMENSKAKDLESSENSYFPKIDVGGSYLTVNQKTNNVAGDIYSGFVKIGVDLYDGGAKSSTVAKNKVLLEASKLQTSAYTKSIELSIVQDFFDIKTAGSSLKALEEKNTQLQAELSRIEQFYSVGSATKDEIDKLQAELSNNLYAMESTKYQILSLKKMLSIKTGIQVESLDDATLQIPNYENQELSDSIQAMQKSAESYEYMAKNVNAAYMPKLSLEDSYTLYDYDRSDATHYEGIDNQNRLTLSFSMRLYDNGSIKNQKESITLQKMALNKEIEESKKTLEVNQNLAISKIQTAKAQIQSAKSTLESATSAYKTISEKYQVGVVDNVSYLDALSTKTNAMAQYDKALNDLQVAYANYYYYANKNIKDFVK